jgi:hypothetical protein
MFCRENVNACFLVRNIVIYSGNVMTQGYARISLKLKPNGSPSSFSRQRNIISDPDSLFDQHLQGSPGKGMSKVWSHFRFYPFPPGFSSTATTISTARFEKEILSMQEYLSEFHKTLAPARDSSITPVEDRGDKS